MQNYGKTFFERQKEYSLQSAREIIPQILKLIQPRKIIDVGCGLGTWLSVFEEYGVDDILGIDGNYIDRNMLLIPEGRFVSFDLKKPIEIDEQFDLVISLEVAEHLPCECAETFVNSLTKLGPVILFSAAVPGQAKTRGEHLNEQWPDYWISHFQRNGFEVIDCIRGRIWKNKEVAWWYAQNVLMFFRADYLENHPVLKTQCENNIHPPVSIVHPILFLQWSDLNNLPPMRLLWLLKKILLAIPISMRRRATKRQWYRFCCFKKLH